MNGKGDKLRKGADLKAYRDNFDAAFRNKENFPNGKTCSYKKNSGEPCPTCPRLTSCLYMCEFLKEGLEDN